MTLFWRTWLMIWCGGVAVFGLVLAGAGLEATDGVSADIFRLLGGDGNFTDALRFSTALMGAVTFGWSLTTVATLQAAFMLGDRARPVWLLTVLSILGWYVIDSTLSIATGFGLNAVSNTVIVAAFLLPILRSGVLRRDPSMPLGSVSRPA